MTGTTREESSSPTPPAWTVVEARSQTDVIAGRFLTDPELYWIQAMETGDRTLHPGGGRWPGEAVGDGRARSWLFGYANKTHTLTIGPDSTQATVAVLGWVGAPKPLPKELPTLRAITDASQAPPSSESSATVLWWNPGQVRMDGSVNGTTVAFDLGLDTPEPPQYSRLSFKQAFAKASQLVPPDARLIQVQKSPLRLPIAYLPAEGQRQEALIGIDLQADGRSVQWTLRFNVSSRVASVIVVEDQARVFDEPFFPMMQPIAVADLLDSTEVPDNGYMTLEDLGDVCWSWTQISGDVGIRHFTDARTGQEVSDCRQTAAGPEAS